MRTARDVLPGFTNNAPAMLVIATNLEGHGQGHRPSRSAAHLATGFGAAAACVALAAQEVGIGVCTVTSWSDTAVRALLDLPAHVRPDITVALGYVPDHPKPGPRGSHGPAVYLNSFGQELS
jgi:nitroreductase